MGNRLEQLLKEEAVKHGDRLQIVPVSRLNDMKRELEEFESSEELNGFQKWILHDIYRYELPETGFEVKSIIIQALSHPFSADIELSYEGKLYPTKALVYADADLARSYVINLLHEHSFHAYETFNIPMKRLAVQSGLAEYGRNNITYMEGMGSNISYQAFFTDMPCEEDEWRSPVVANRCTSCNQCIKLCPTGAIREDRFLINNERCLSCMNEGGGDFPDWLPDDVHHTLYDCLRCQEKCPMNAEAVKDTIGPIRFTEEETLMLLEGKGLEDFSKEFLDKVKPICLFYCKDGLARNIRAVIKAAGY